MSAPRHAGVIASVVAFTFLTTVENIQPHGWLDWYHIAKEGKKTQAQITHKRPPHQTCFLQYVIDDNIYNGSVTGCNFKVGQSATITYLPSDPSFVTLENPTHQLGFLLFATFFTSVAGGFVVAFRAHKQGR